MKRRDRPPLPATASSPPNPKPYPPHSTRNQGIKAVRDEVAAFISQRDGAELPPADPEEVRCAFYS